MSATGLVARPAMAHPSDGPTEPVSVEADLMGGRVGIHIRPARPPRDGQDDGAGAAGSAQHAAESTMRRIASWAGRLTRFDQASELSRLNADPSGEVSVGPTLAAVLEAARVACRETGGIVDPTLLVERQAAEEPRPMPSVDGPSTGARRWTVTPGRRGALVSRDPEVRFDLGGVAKGWIADRAADALATWPAVLVDADGDLAMDLAFDEAWDVAVADPRSQDARLGTFRLVGLHPARRQRFGLATSGTSVHRWTHDGVAAHHLIDPWTRRPAITDIVQATVLADSAMAAEAAAKALVILGSARAERLLDHPAIRACLILTDDDRVLASPSVLRWLA